MTTSVLYYTCCQHDPAIEQACRTQLRQACGDRELVTVALRPIAFGDVRLVLDRPRSPLTLHRQILAGLERASGDVVFMAESDVLYHPSHFDFRPTREDCFYYNIHVWRIRYADGHAVRTAICRQVSGLVAQRALLLEHYRRRVARIEAEGRFDRRIGYEPGCNHYPRGIDAYEAAEWSASVANLDIRHDRTMTRSKWSQADFRNPRWAEGWEETDGEIPGWGRPAAIIGAMKAGVLAGVT